MQIAESASLSARRIAHGEAGRLMLGFTAVGAYSLIPQLLVSIIGVGALFSLYQQNFLMAHFWALVVILFTCALTLAEVVARLEKRVQYYAGVRH